MPLQSTGQISLNDIKTEFVGTNPININQYYRGGIYVPNTPINASIPTSGTIRLSDFYGASAVTDFINEVPLSYKGIYAAIRTSIGVDNSGNVYVLNSNNTAPDASYQIFLAKYNPNGINLWQVTLGTFTNGRNDHGIDISVSGAGNIYVLGVANYALNDQYLVLAKYNTNGTLQWQRKFADDNDVQINPRSIAIDPSGNVYFGADRNFPGTQFFDFIIVKYNTNGIIQWQRTLGDTNTQSAYSISVDSSGNVYASGPTDTGGPSILIAKYNTSGTIQWQRQIGGSSPNVMSVLRRFSISVDSSANSYTTAASDNGNSIYLIKYDTNGNFQWDRKLINPSSFCIPNNNTSDSSGNVYIVGQHTTSTATIVKYNTFGTIQWQRSLTNYIPDSVSYLASLNRYYMSGEIFSGSKYLIFTKLPGDGSLTGTYGSFSYSTLSLTSSISSTPRSNSSYLSSSSTIVESVGTLSTGAPIPILATLRTYVP